MAKSREAVGASAAVLAGQVSHVLFSRVGRHCLRGDVMKQRQRRRRLLMLFRRSSRRSGVLPVRRFTQLPNAWQCRHAQSSAPAQASEHASGCLHETAARPDAGKATLLRKRRFSSSSFTGVTRTRNGRWQAQISIAGKQTYLGTFNTEQAAAKARCWWRTLLAHSNSFRDTNH